MNKKIYFGIFLFTVLTLAAPSAANASFITSKVSFFAEVSAVCPHPTNVEAIRIADIIVAVAL